MGIFRCRRESGIKSVIDRTEVPSLGRAREGFIKVIKQNG